jgi:hypothetical protein
MMADIDTGTLRMCRGKAIRFLGSCVGGGLARSYDSVRKRWVKPYPEVTGYLLSLFAKDIAAEFPKYAVVERLLKIQRPCGGFRSIAGGASVYVFDTAQICMGLLDSHCTGADERLLDACVRGAEFIRSMQLPNGSVFPIYDERRRERVAKGNTWGDSFSPINCKCVQFLLRLAAQGSYLDCRNFVEGICEWTLRQPQMLYSHPGAYALEGLCSAGYTDCVRSRLEGSFLPRVQENGFLSYHPDVPYAYVSGSVQIGLLCALVGLTEPAFRICQWAMRVQAMHPSGGLFQYANADCGPNLSVHGEINSWGTKYYVELLDFFLDKGPGETSAVDPQ